jgi:undecaprenyl-diphosphatase
MLELLQHWDATLFHWINSSLSNPIFNTLLPWCREKWFWMPVYLFVVAFSLVNYKARGLVLVLGLVLAAGLSDFTSSTLVKKNVQRLRPCNDPERIETLQLRAPCGSGYSFTSSHAANHFAVAIFLIGVFGGLATWLRPVALSWAGLIAFSQVYVGVHYPGDVLCGAILGSVIGWWTLVTYRRWAYKWVQIRQLG